MKKTLLFLISLLFFTQVFAQLTEDQETLIKNSLAKKINALRLQKGLHKLEVDKDLADAAKLQTKYMSEKKTTTLLQDDDLYETTFKRVKYHNQSFDSVAENIIKTRALAPPFNSKKINYITSIVYNTWRKSSDATKKMLSSTYSYADFGITYNNELKQFFVSNVFGNKKHKVPNQLSEFAFGIKENKDNKHQIINKHDAFINSLSNYIYIKNGEVFLDIKDTSGLKELIIAENDGLAIDLISRNQIQCGISNKLDDSPIYDGVLLKPLYKNEIFSSLKNGKISLGKVPDAIIHDELSANLIILQENIACQYITSNKPIKNNVEVLLPVEIELVKPYIDLQNQGIYLAKEIFFDFETSKSVTDKYTEAQFDLDNVHSFSIKSYTSVDGSESSNKVLQNKRAQFIKKHIGDVLGFSLDFVKIRIDARENWNLYNYQLKLFGHYDMLDKNKSQKRSFANNTLRGTWDEQFDNQRKSKIIAFQHGYWNRNNKQHGFYNLLNGLITDDVHLVNKSLQWLYNKDVNYNLNKDFILDRLLTNKDLVQNVAALFQKNIDKYDLNYVVYFLDNWLHKPEILTEEAQKNLLSLYTITTLEILKDWNEDNQRLARIIAPKNVEQLFKVYKAKTQTNSLIINYHIARIEYYKKIEKESNIQTSLDFIFSNYSKYNTTVEEKIRLASFFNKWKHYDLSSDLLLKGYKENKLNPDGMLLLSQTLSVLSNTKVSANEIKDINQKALTLNKEKWCDWMDHNFQLFTKNTTKDLFCKSCAKK